MCSVARAADYLLVFIAYFVPLFLFISEEAVSIFQKLPHVEFDIPPSSFSMFLCLNDPASGATIYFCIAMYTFQRFTICIALFNPHKSPLRR